MLGKRLEIGLALALRGGLVDSQLIAHLSSHPRAMLGCVDSGAAFLLARPLLAAWQPTLRIYHRACSVRMCVSLPTRSWRRRSRPGLPREHPTRGTPVLCPEMGLEQASLLGHPSFLVACQRNPCPKGMRCTEVSTLTASLLPTSFPCFHPKPLTPAVRSGIASILAVPQVVWLLNLG